MKGHSTPSGSRPTVCSRETLPCPEGQAGSLGWEMGVLTSCFLLNSAFLSCPFSPSQSPRSPCLLRQPVGAVFCPFAPPSGRQLPGPKLKPLAAQSQSLGSHGGFNFLKCKNQPFIKLKPSISGYKAALSPPIACCHQLAHVSKLWSPRVLSRPTSH